MFVINQHSYSFFGQNTGIILNSASQKDPYWFLKCIKKKSDGVWEKPGQREGQTIKFSLEETVSILQVLTSEVLSWSEYHSYKEQKTAISFKWENGIENLWINIGNYSKILNSSQVAILRMLLEHILKEKITYATGYKEKDTEKIPRIDTSPELPEIRMEPEPEQKQEQKQEYETKEKKVDEVSAISGAIKGETEKALLILFGGNKEIWIPKSTIKPSFLSQKDMDQDFLVENWILKRNNLI